MADEDSNMIFANIQNENIVENYRTRSMSNVEITDQVAKRNLILNVSIFYLFHIVDKFLGK